MTTLKHLTILALLIVVAASASVAQQSNLATQVVAFGVKRSNSVQLARVRSLVKTFISSSSEVGWQGETTVAVGGLSAQGQKFSISLFSRKSSEQSPISSKSESAYHNTQSREESPPISDDERQSILITVTD
ncbi:MAG TPA: hypothetical protein VI704_02060 [Bacteroidota bacterium]|nr:hypothetical protein [Bacteroidota bacterium]